MLLLRLCGEKGELVLTLQAMILLEGCGSSAWPGNSLSCSSVTSQGENNSLMPFLGVFLWIRVSVTGKMRYQRTIIPTPAIKHQTWKELNFIILHQGFWGSLHVHKIELSDTWHQERVQMLHKDLRVVWV